MVNPLIVKAPCDCDPNPFRTNNFRSLERSAPPEQPVRVEIENVIVHHVELVRTNVHSYSRLLASNRADHLILHILHIRVAVDYHLSALF